jgi:ATP-dependent DNA helicase RecG
MKVEIIELTGDQVEELLLVEESHFVDLKAVEIAPASLSKAVSAFGNSAGGELFVGIDEHEGADGAERRWRGFADPEAANAILQTVEQLSPLGSHYAAEFLRSGEQTGLILHLTIFKAREILRASNGKPYVRRGAQKLPVEGEDALRRLEYDKGVFSFEDQVADAGLADIANSATILEFLLRVVPTAEPEEWLSKQRLLADGRPTVAGVVLFCDEPQAILPKRSAIKIFRYRTKAAEGERDYLDGDPLTIEGPAYEQIYSAVDKARQIVESIERLGAAGMERVFYPPEALHEIITNAVLHRDYSIPVDVQVRIFDNRIEVESPGRLPGHITVKNILKEQFARNPKVVRLINKFPNPPNKDVGEGLNTAFEAMEKLRLRKPIIEDRENSVVITLRHESLGSPEQLVLEYLENHEEITNSIGRELTGIKSENTMKEAFYRLRDRGLLEQVPGKLGNKAAWRRTGKGHAG